MRGEIPELAAAKRAIALAPAGEKLRTLEVEALRLAPLSIPMPDKVDALMEGAETNGLCATERQREDAEHIIGMGLSGRSPGVGYVPRNAKQNGDAKQEAPQRQHRRALIVQRASDVVVKPVEWLWPGRVAIGKHTLIAGEPGLGKSLVAAAMAAAVTTGGPWPCSEGRAPLGNVVILSAEDDAADTIVPRLMAAGADCKRVHIVTAVRAGDGRSTFSLQSDLALLEQKIGEIGNVSLVEIDPISSYLGAVDTHVNAAVRAVLEPLSEMAARRRVAVVSISHMPKGTGQAAINRIIGSIAFAAAPRAVSLVIRDAEDESRRLLVPAKNNLAPLGKGLAFRLTQHIVSDGAAVASCVVWESEHIEITADQALRAADERGAGGQRPGDEAADFLRSALGSGPMPVSQLKDDAAGIGLAWRTIRRAKERLGVRATKTGMDAGWVWELSKVATAPEDGHRSKEDTFAADGHLRTTNDEWPDLPACLDRRSLHKPRNAR